MLDSHEYSDFWTGLIAYGGLPIGGAKNPRDQLKNLIL